MKKTIAILLVLVIGMAGVWAAEVTTAELLLKTDVPLYNLLAITDAETTSFDFEDYENTSLNEEFDIAGAFTDPVTAAYLHYKTNNVGTVTLKIKGAALASDQTGSQTPYMPYTLTVGNATIETVDDTEVTSADNVFEYLQEGLQTASLPIEVQITEGSSINDYAAGYYSTTVSFIFTAN